MPSRWAEKQTFIARRFFLATVAQAVVCGLLAWILAVIIGPPVPTERVRIPGAFIAGTLFLIAGSWFLQCSIMEVRRERQIPFRRDLLLALVSAMLFVGVQSFGLWAFSRATLDSHDPQQNAHGFIFMFTALHAMHFVVAQSVLLWVTLCAFMDRYDHEYYWGVTFASWFWHLLGIAWFGILCVFSIAA